MAADFWAHHYTENPDSEKEAIDDDFSMEEELRKANEEAEGLPDDFEEI